MFAGSLDTWGSPVPSWGTASGRSVTSSGGEHSLSTSEDESNGGGFLLTHDYFSQNWVKLSAVLADISLVLAELPHAITKVIRNDDA